MSLRDLTGKVSKYLNPEGDRLWDDDNPLLRGLLKTGSQIRKAPSVQRAGQTLARQKSTFDRTPSGTIARTGAQLSENVSRGMGQRALDIAESGIQNAPKTLIRGAGPIGMFASPKIPDLPVSLDFIRKEAFNPKYDVTKRDPFSEGVGRFVTDTAILQGGARAINANNTLAPIQQVAGKQAGKLYAMGKDTGGVKGFALKQGGKSLAEVSQSLPYTLQSLLSNVGEGRDAGGGLALDLAIDTVLGSFMGKGFNKTGNAEKIFVGKVTKAIKNRDDALLEQAVKQAKANGIEVSDDMLPQLRELSRQIREGVQKLNTDQRGGINVPTDNELINKAKKYKSPKEFADSLINSYHGTKGDFDKFDLNKAGTATDSGMYGKGIYTSDARHVAYGYANKGDTPGKVLDTYVNLKNPYIIKNSSDIPTDKQLGLKEPTSIEDYKNATNEYSTKFREYLMGRGYDGVIDEMGGASKQLVAFEPESVKTRAELEQIYNQANKLSPDFYKYDAVKGADADITSFRDLVKRDPNNPLVQIYLDKYKGIDDRFQNIVDMYKTQRGGVDLSVFGSRKSAPKDLPVMKSDEDSLRTGEALSELGVDTPKREFSNWVNARRATNIEGILKGKEFKNLDSKGINGIIEFQSGNKSGDYKAVKDFLDFKYKQLQDEGINFNYKDDYLTQIWKQPPEEVDKVYRSLGLKPGFTKEAIFKNYQQGIEAGLTPKYTKISDIVGSYERATNKAIADHKFFKYMVDDGLIVKASKAPRDWVTLDADRFPRFEVKTDKGVYGGTYKAPPTYAKMINNYLGNGNFEELAKVADLASTIKNRVLSFGVPKTAINSHGFNILSRNIMASRNPLEGAYTGIKYMINPNSASKQLDATLEKAPQAIKNGLTLSTNEYDAILEEPEKAFRSKFGEAWGNLFEKGLFNKMLPALKLQKYEEVYQGFLKGGMSEDEAGREAAKFINTVFGGMNWQELGKSRDWQNFLRATILAPDWAKTNIELVKKLPESVIKFKDPVLAPYRRFLATFLGTYVTMNVVNKLATGHFMFQNDPGNAFNVEAGYTEDGQKRYIRPFGTSTDFARLPAEVLASLKAGDTTKIGRIVRNRLSIPLGAAVGFLMDTDYTGQPIGYKGVDKYGNEIPTKQRLLGVGGEIATVAGMPAFSKQGLDFISGKTGGEQALLQGMELPFRYSGGTKSTIQKQAQEVNPLTGKDLYTRNTELKGQSALSDKQLGKVKAGETTIENILSTRNANRVNSIRKEYSKGDITREEAIKKITEVAPITYDTSSDSPQGIKKTMINIESFAANPVETIKLWQKGEPIRKVRLSGDTTFEQAVNFFDAVTVSERADNVGRLDSGDTQTQVDHIKSKWLGGREEPENYQILTLEEHDKKTKLDEKLLKQYEAGEITKADAWKQLREFNATLNGKPVSEDQIYGLVIEATIPKTKIGGVKTAKPAKVKTTKKTTAKKTATTKTKKAKKIAFKKLPKSKVKLPKASIPKAPKIVSPLTSGKKAKLSFKAKTYEPVKIKKKRNTIQDSLTKLV